MQAKAFIVRGYLGLNNEYVVVEGTRLIGNKDIEIDFFTGRFDETGMPVYQNDKVAYDVINEFGSAHSFTGVVRYDAVLMRYVIDMEGVFNDNQEREGDIIIRKVTGHNHD